MRNRKMLKSAVCSLLALIMLLSMLMGTAAAASYPYAGVITKETNMRREPDSSKSNVIVRIPKGDQVTVTGASGNFYRIEYDGRTGYVFKQYVKEGTGSVSSVFTADGYPYTTTTTASTALRKTASTSAKKLATIPKGASVTVNRLSGSFANVSYGSKTGWCLKKYVKLATIVEPTPTPVVVTVAPSTNASGYQLLQSGVSGDHVIALQEALNELGYLRSAADGIYGSATAQAVMALQRANDYPITGTADANLQAFIFSGKVVNAEGDKVTVRTLPAIRGLNISSGDRGLMVRTLQSRLQELGYYTGAITGVYDTATVKAVRLFQKANGIKQDGIAGASTQEKLLGSSAVASGATPTPSPTPSPTPLPTFNVPENTVRRGSTGEDARRVQQRLIELGYLTGKADGKFGADSVQALKAFQKANGVTADGVAGQGTFRVLYSHMAIPAGYVAPVTPVPTAVVNETIAPAQPSYEPVTRDNVVVIRLGVTGSAVLRLQNRLTELGYYASAADAVCKEDDVAAIRAFQRMNRLDVDGVAGYDTQVKLYASTAIADNGDMAGSITNHSTLKKGMTGEAVAEMQKRLISLGYLTGTADGVYGTNTAEAVYNFQKRNGLVRDGVAGVKTLQALYSLTAAQPTPAPTPAPTTPVTIPEPLRKGDVSNSVKTLQQRLIALGYLKGSADGVFGVRTYEAVKAFQKANALTADGIAGNKTIAALNNLGTSNGQTGGTVTAPTVTTAPGLAPSLGNNNNTSSSGNAGLTVQVTAANVVYEYWYSTVRNACRKYPYATVYDYSTGISWQVHMFSYGKHAEAEPLTAADTAKMEQAFGGNTWTPKPVWVIFADGTIRMATTHSMPHQVQHIKDNDFAGHTCIHFPRTMAQVTAIGPYATRHQNTVDTGWAATRAMIR